MYYCQLFITKSSGKFPGPTFHIYAASDSKAILQAGRSANWHEQDFLFITSAGREGEPVAQQTSSAPTVASAANADPPFVH
jgi:hypothetical protein